MFKYTICFIKQTDRILLLNRENPSWMGSWNGVGGKLEEEETPTQCVIREVFEETGIKLEKVEFKGIVTWSIDDISSDGMYAFVAEVKDDFLYETPKQIDEGILDWKKIDWIFHPRNTGVVENLTKFLPKMLEDTDLFVYKCFYKNNSLVKFESKLLKQIVVA